MTSASSARPEILPRRARILLPIFLVILLVLAVRQLWCLAPARSVLGGSTMGTTWSVVLDAQGRGRADPDAARAAIEERLAFVDRLMSTWNAESELSRFNRHASAEPFRLSPETLGVLAVAQEISGRTHGAFDVTVRPLVAAWGFGAGAWAPGHGPDPAELAAIRERVGYRLLELDPFAGAARKRRPDVECDLSAIAKGFAVDEVARALSDLGWTDFLVEVGGEVRARGNRPQGGPWQVGIERPDSEGRVAQAVVALADLAMATSGDYRSFYEDGGRRLSHIIDPRSGRPVAHTLASVSVVHAEAVRADAWATALAVLGPQEGFLLAEAEGIGAVFLVRAAGGSFEARSTRAFPALHEPRSAPDRSVPAGSPRDRGRAAR
jgi:thiamine biosynthesis lipoprotein